MIHFLAIPKHRLTNPHAHERKCFNTDIRYPNTIALASTPKSVVSSTGKLTSIRPKWKTSEEGRRVRARKEIRGGPAGRTEAEEAEETLTLYLTSAELDALLSFKRVVGSCSTDCIPTLWHKVVTVANCSKMPYWALVGIRMPDGKNPRPSAPVFSFNLSSKQILFVQPSGCVTPVFATDCFHSLRPYKDVFFDAPSGQTAARTSWRIPFSSSLKQLSREGDRVQKRRDLWKALCVRYTRAQDLSLEELDEVKDSFPGRFKGKLTWGAWRVARALKQASGISGDLRCHYSFTSTPPTLVDVRNIQFCVVRLPSLRMLSHHRGGMACSSQGRSECGKKMCWS